MTSLLAMIADDLLTTSRLVINNNYAVSLASSPGSTHSPTSLRYTSRGRRVLIVGGAWRWAYCLILFLMYLTYYDTENTLFSCTINTLLIHSHVCSTTWNTEHLFQDRGCLWKPWQSKVRNTQCFGPDQTINGLTLSKLKNGTIILYLKYAAHNLLISASSSPLHTHPQVLPVDPNSQFITFTLDNNCVFSLRTSGTEPKIKYYVELSTEPGTRWDTLVICVMFIFAVYHTNNLCHD